MLDNNLAVLLAQRLDKITNVSKATGISRTTLTNMYYKRSKSISNETLEKLCDYLDCDIGDLIVINKKALVPNPTKD